MRREPSPVEKGTKRDEHDVVVGVGRRQEAVAVVGLQAGALLPDGSAIDERGGGHLVEEEESREEPDGARSRGRRKRHEVKNKCLNESRRNPGGQILCRNPILSRKSDFQAN